ncbi:GTP cyclohydrolase II [Promineifilum sp.]|uniref:GTP cyclohydrolase II n=1 Tax=Promineifilum sp. TaxID=2664178 RepID=UPI0035B3E4DD
MACARIPTDVGEFTLCLYHNDLDGKEHLALIVGDLTGNGALPPPLVRVHSECFTGDVLGSRRCDCGPQLAAAMALIAQEGRGVILYLRQEGRGIGLLEKLRAYNLQDLGYDTVEANLLLGHQPDLRDYRVAALMLRDLGVPSLRLLTNNPDKIAGLERAGLTVSERVPLQTPLHADNAHYLDTKVRRMRHLLDLDETALNGFRSARPPAAPPAWLDAVVTASSRPEETLRELAAAPPSREGRPFITLSYAQSLDGSIAARRGEPTTISGPEAMRLTHQLRAHHDAILVGIGTVIADDPQLTVRLVRGPDPQPVVLDSRLRFPAWARLLREGRRPWIATTEAADRGRQAELEAAGARVVRLPADGNGMVNLEALLAFLDRRHIRSLMIEGGATVISSVLAAHLADRLVLTIAPLMLGGLNAVANLGQLNGQAFPHLTHPRHYAVGRDVVLAGELAWE